MQRSGEHLYLWIQLLTGRGSGVAVHKAKNSKRKVRDWQLGDEGTF